MAVVIIDMETGKILEESGMEEEDTPKGPEERPRVPPPQPRLQEVVVPSRKKDKGWHPIYGV